MAGVEVCEEVGGDLGAQGIDVLRRFRGIERPPVDELEGPRPHAHDDIASSQLVPPPNDGAEAEMSERAPDVGVHVDRSHGVDGAMLRRLSTV
jgi:hypothetical protein